MRVTYAAEPTEVDGTTPALPALAVLVHTEPGGEALAEPLRALLEVETSQRYEGAMLERAEIATVLQELKLSLLLGSGGAEAGAVQAGKMDKAACLVLARVSEKKVNVTVTSFPKTEVILDKEYSERLEAASLAERISGDALSAVRARARDSKTPYVSIGSFYCVDPHRRLLEFSRATEAEMRKQLSATPDVRLMERMFPSDLLNEFNLARGGMTVSQATDFSAPPADLLIYGECTPQKDQDLNNPGIVLDCVVTVTSPTSLIPTRSITATCRSDDITPLIEKSKALLVETVATARENLAKGSERTFSTQEFEAFKKQAFRLMPTPPNADGVFYQEHGYNGRGQSGKHEELERALRMLECAQLFTGTDTTVLVSTAAVLSGLAAHNAKAEPVRNALLDAATELADRAYRIESNWNTRGFYSSFNLEDHWRGRGTSNVNLVTARHIWSTRDTERWWPSTLDTVFARLVALESDRQYQERLLVEAVPIYRKRANGLRTLMTAVQPLLLHGSRSVTSGGGEKSFAANADFSSRLIAGKDPFLQAIGHLIAVDLMAKQYSVEPDTRYGTEFLKHYRAAAKLSSDLEALYGNEFTLSNFNARLNQYLASQTEMLTKAGATNEIVDMKVEYVLSQLRTPKANLNGIPKTLRQILPTLQESQKDDLAVELLTTFLTHYNHEGGGDSDRMEFTRAFNEYSFAREKREPLRSEQLTLVPFDDGQTGSVRRMVTSPHGLFGVRVQYSSAVVFQLPPGQTKAKVIAGPSLVNDVACTDKYIAVGTQKDGLYLLDATTHQPRQLTPANSALPGAAVPLVTNDGADLLIGIPDKDNRQTLFYRLEPDAGRLTETESKFAIHSYWRIKSQPGNAPVVPQNWKRRTAVMDGKLLTFTVADTLKTTKNVTVTDEDGRSVLDYRGFELTYVYDFLTWHNYLVFATGNGLYVSKPGTNELRCILSEPDLSTLACSVVGDKMYLGTNKGVYVLNEAQFLKASNG